MPASPTSNSYDEIPYSDNCFPYTHPDHLAAVKRLFGMTGTPPERCSVLELGAARGGNLIPMALELPEARFVGIDLSVRQVAEGQSIVKKLGLRNVDLRAMSITELDEPRQSYDYIICHGVYSWVPEAVRDKIMAICAEALAADGVAYVSYNTYPGWHARGMVRELMAYHDRRASKAPDRVQRARDFLEDLVRVLPDQSSSYARILAAEGEFLRGVANTYLCHEHLEETNHPVYFHEFMARAREHGLNFLAEACMPGLAANFSPKAKVALDTWADDEVAREQYLDFLCNRAFRRTLLCRAGATRSANPAPEAITMMSISTGLMAVSSAPDVASDRPEEFRRSEGGANLTTNNPLVKSALAALCEIRPHAMTFGDLSVRVRSFLAEHGVGMAEPAASARILSESLLQCFLADLVDLHVRPPRFAAAAGQLPIAARLARLQAEEGGRVTNLRRRTTHLDEFDRVVLARLDGARDRSSILAALAELVASGEFTVLDGDQPVHDPATIDAILAAELEPSLERLARLALLVA